MKKFIFIFFIAVFVFMPFVSGAVPPPGEGVGKISSPANVGKDSTIVSVSNADDIGNIFVRLVNWFAWFVAVLAVAFGLYAGVLFITASGDESKLKKARDIFIYVIVGVIVSILSFGIVAISQTLLR